MYLILVFLPFFGFLSAALFGRSLGFKGAAIITIGCLFGSCLLSFFVFYEVGLAGSPVYIEVCRWIDLETFNVNWGFLFDTLTVVMCVVICFISLLVHIYSAEYMAYDPHLSRFMSYLSLFTFFMLILVTADNYIQMFVGWEGVGLCSYLLINFWFTRIQANKAAIKAMIVNRIGDFGLILAIITMFRCFNSVDYATIFAIAPYFKYSTFNFFIFNWNTLTLICCLLFVGAIGKSAQLGLHTWLPDAMEGPTPVSALIHAATMVTAGVFLIVRSSPLFEYSYKALQFVTAVGACTAFFAATIGLLQNDLKKVIAYSTCSQLGYMVFACGLSNYSVGIFHLANHAFFKALLFLGAGSIIHSVFDEQDIRKMGGLKNLIPFTYSVMLIGSLALMGFPYLTGFYSKDVILEVAFGKYTVISFFAYILGSTAAFFTAFYSIRLIHLTFLSECNAYKYVYHRNIQDSNVLIQIPLIFLSIPSIFIGYISKDMIIGIGTDFWGNSIYVSPANLNVIDSEFIPIFWKNFPVLVSLIGAFFSFFFYTYGNRFLFYLKRSKLGKEIYVMLNKKWFFDRIYYKYLNQPLFLFSYDISYKIIDKKVIELLGPQGISHILYKHAFSLQKIQSGFLFHYTLMVLVGLNFFFITFDSSFFVYFYDKMGSLLPIFLLLSIFF